MQANWEWLAGILRQADLDITTFRNPKVTVRPIVDAVQLRRIRNRPAVFVRPTVVGRNRGIGCLFCRGDRVHGSFRGSPQA